MRNETLLSDTAGGILLNVHVQPRASRTAISGWTEEGLRIRLTSPPVDGAANRLCTEFLAKIFGVPKSSVKVVTGEKSRKKVVRVEGMSVPEAEDAIARATESGK
jgi:uncharacterized protein